MRVPKHIVERRRERLRELIRSDGFLPVAQICERLKVSEATARRDLAVIAEAGQITRTHGGALADYNASFSSVGERAQRARTGKGRVAAAAFARLPRTGTVFLDAGTTIHALAQLIVRRRTEVAKVTFVTNNLAVATVLGAVAGLELHVLGGTFLHRQSALFGPDAVRSLEGWRFAAAFLGGEGIDADGVTNSHQEIAAFQREVMKRTNCACFCIDATKLGRATPHRVVDWQSGALLITDATAAQLRAEGLPVEPTIRARSA